MINDSMTFTKEEAVVLMDILKLSHLPSTLAMLPTVSGSGYARIAKAFYDAGALTRDKAGLRMDKGLAQLLTPLEKAKQILLYSAGENGRCTRSLSIYFAPRGAVALRELDSDRLEFLRIGSAAELLLLLPAPQPGSTPVHCSFWHFTEEVAMVHVATLPAASDTVYITESRRAPGQPQARESQSTRSPADYAAWWKSLLKEVYRVSDY